MASQRAARNDAGFISNAGATIATWGLGLCLLCLNWATPGQMQLLPLILMPVAVGALVIAVCSSNDQKRVDASHIHCLALAGSMAPFSLGMAYFLALAAALVVLNLLNARRSLMLAPMGPSIVFVALLSPQVSHGLAVACLCAVILAFTARAGGLERQVAMSAFPLLASLSMALGGVQPVSVAFFLLAGAHIAAVHYLRGVRAAQNIVPTERRMLLDDVVTALALLLMMKSVAEMEPHVRYAAVAALFAAAAGGRRVARMRWVSPVRALARPWRAWLRDNELKQRAALVTFCIYVALAVMAWPSSMRHPVWGAVQAAILLGVGSALFAAGSMRPSHVQRDAAKLLLVTATLWSALTITVYALNSLGWLGLAMVSVVLYAAMALSVFAAGRDLGTQGAAAWQGIFSGRALAMIRRARSRVFDIVSQAPAIGWMFHLGDKAARNLQGTFGSAKTWTIAHYCVCIVIAVGALPTNALFSELLVTRRPELLGLLMAGVDESKRSALRSSFLSLSTVVIYCAAVFLAGTLLRRPYLRALAFILACFLMAVQAFVGLTSSNDGISLAFYPLAFCVLMALFRIFYRSDKAKVPSHDAAPAAEGDVQAVAPADPPPLRDEAPADAGQPTVPSPLGRD